MSAVAGQISITKFLNKIDKPNNAETLTAVKSNYDKVEKRTNIPEEFAFPYRPYTIQQNLMRNVYQCIEERKLGIFESPTGTGKSLSLLCASLTWLTDHENLRRQELETKIKEAEEQAENDTKAEIEGGDWIETYKKKRNATDKVTQLKEDYSKFVKVDDKIKNLRDRTQKKREVKKSDEIEDFLKEMQNLKQSLNVENEGQDNLDSDLILKDYESGDDEVACEDEVDENDELNTTVTKIYYCSRTHSQLSQFVGEVKKSSFSDKVRVVTLSSRQNACLNEPVLKLKSLNFMNDRCLELQKHKNGKETRSLDERGGTKKKKVTNGCPFFKKHAIRDLQENILSEIQDIEEISRLGYKNKACPYYASRLAVPLAQLVVVPYNTLLSKQTREACGIKLKDNIIIIDEAHNLNAAISNIHSCVITGNQLLVALSQLSQYKQRYISRLKAKNLFYIQQIIFITKSLLKYFKDLFNNGDSNAEETVSVINLNDFVIDLGIDNLNLFKILRYCKRSEIARKLLGFSEKYSSNPCENKNPAKTAIGAFLDSLTTENKTGRDLGIENEYVEQEKKPSSSPLMQIEEFFRCLTNLNKDGRIVATRNRNGVENCNLKYYLLNPAVHFQDIVSQARAVILAGGTLQPVEEFTEQLFLLAGADMNRIMHFSCGHVIPSSHLLSVALTHGPGGQELNFSYSNRLSTPLLDDLGRAILSVANVVPGGLVVFFPSYSYAEKVINHWEGTKALTKISAKKQVFIEPRQANETNAILDAFTKCIMETKAQVISVNSTAFMKTGAILFCVVGGKMSEGINFSDDLGRCVIVVGMPYPNKDSPELQEKMKYLNTTLPSTPNGKMPGQLYYEHICMKAVNQSIGRAIRHQKDYATILLMDSRYSRLSVQQSLPQWIQNQIKTCQKFGPAFAAIRKFFQDKKSEERKC